AREWRGVLGPRKRPSRGPGQSPGLVGPRGGAIDTIGSMLTLKPIGFVKSPYTTTKEIPKGLGAKHEADGALEIMPEFEVGLTDIDGFSHLFVLWVFHRSEGFDLLGTPPTD